MQPLTLKSTPTTRIRVILHRTRALPALAIAWSCHRRRTPKPDHDRLLVKCRYAGEAARIPTELEARAMTRVELRHHASPVVTGAAAVQEPARRAARARRDGPTRAVCA